MKYPQPQTLLSPRQDLVDVTDVKLHQTFRYKKQYHVATTVSPRSFVGHDCAVLWWLCARQASPIPALKPVITCFGTASLSLTTWIGRVQTDQMRHSVRTIREDRIVMVFKINLRRYLASSRCDRIRQRYKAPSSAWYRER